MHRHALLDNTLSSRYSWDYFIIEMDHSVFRFATRGQCIKGKKLDSLNTTTYFVLNCNVLCPLAANRKTRWSISTFSLTTFGTISKWCCLKISPNQNTSLEKLPTYEREPYLFACKRKMCFLIPLSICGQSYKQALQMMYICKWCIKVLIANFYSPIL